MAKANAWLEENPPNPVLLAVHLDWCGCGSLIIEDTIAIERQKGLLPAG